MPTSLLVLGSLVVGFLAGWLGPARYHNHYVRVPPPPMDDALAPPDGSARTSAYHARELVGLADRLAARDICVRRLADYGGGWELVLQKGADADRGEMANQNRRTRVVWDGKEKLLSIQWVGAPRDRETFPSPPPGLSGEQLLEYLLELGRDAKPKPDEINMKVRGRKRDPIGIAENLLIERFSGSAGTNPRPA